MQIPIINGVYTDTQANYRIAYPRNLVPVPKQTGVSAGYLRIAEGITQLAAPSAALPGVDRGGINWNGVCYRVIGAQLVQVFPTGAVTVLGNVGNDGRQVAFDYSYNYLVIGSAGLLFYYALQPLQSATAAVPATGGAGYAAGDTILLSNSVTLTVGTVNAGAVLTCTVTAGGLVVGSAPPPNPLGQTATSGAGVGATFNLTWTSQPTGLFQVTDVSLLNVVDCLWMQGYTVSTDGTYVIVTDLNNPAYVDPLKYGSTESDPAPVTGLLRFRNELYVCTRYVIAVFDNVGGANFPFQEQLGALVEKGVLSRSLKCKISQRIAFVGGGRNEPISVYFTFSGIAQKIATQEIEEILRGYSEAILSAAILEAREDRVHQHLYLQLPDQTLVYDVAASEIMEQPVWFVLSSTETTYGAYRARNFVWCYNKWLCGDLYDSRVGYLDRSVATQYGALVGNQFDVPLIYNNAKGAIVQRLEVIGLTGLAPIGTKPTMSLSWTRDGKTYSNERFISMGTEGQYQKRLMWINALFMRQVASLRFRAVTSALVSYSRVEAEIEGLAN